MSEAFQLHWYYSVIARYEHNSHIYISSRVLPYEDEGLRNPIG